jgi:hypothetical protein
MGDYLARFINTRLQPGVDNIAPGEPFQRLACAGKPLNRFSVFRRPITGLKPGVNKNMSPILRD